MSAVTHEIFDDLLIGNYMKTTVHGSWGHALAPNVLYTHFTPWVTRYADNARLRTNDDLRTYFAAYRRRAPAAHLLHRFDVLGVQRLRSVIRPGSSLFRAATRAYGFVKRAAV